jgi:hypothetical protein
MDVRFCERRNHAERHNGALGDLFYAFLRAPPKRASAEVRFLLTKTYMDVGNSETRSPNEWSQCVYKPEAKIRIVAG